MQFLFLSLFQLSAFLLIPSSLALEIGVVGGGIAAASAVHFLSSLARQHLSSKSGNETETVVFHLFDQRKSLGGRAHDVWVNGSRIESGASVLHSSNKYLKSFVESLSLEYKDEGEQDGDDGTIGIWNGKEFVFESFASRYPWMGGWLSGLFDTLEALWKFGWSAPTRAKRKVKETVSKWERIYELQERGESFETPTKMFESLDLTEEVSESGYSLLETAGVSPTFMKIYADAVSRVNYGQSGELNGFSELVSLAGAGMTGELLSVKEGNQRVPEGLIRRTVGEERIRLERWVSSVRQLNDGRWEIVSENAPSACEVDDTGEAAEKRQSPKKIPLQRLSKGETETVRVDAVILAAPLELSSGMQIEIQTEKKGEEAEDRTDGPPMPRSRPWQTTHTAFVVASGLDPLYFGRGGKGKSSSSGSTRLPSSVYSVESPDVPFSSISVVSEFIQESPEERWNFKTWKVFKVFSRQPLPESLVRKLFVNYSWHFSIPWKAYPVLTPVTPSEIPPFKIARGLYYANALESLISCMETEAVAGRNVAGLLAEDFLETSEVIATGGIRGGREEFGKGRDLPIPVTGGLDVKGKVDKKQGQEHVLLPEKKEAVAVEL
uniref:Prenylcysteine lyase domain-containing protein n=1 Tax=Chromera velia CCMP2878 TaxID=1169474 RepID=A0A0G4HYK1_9ALVE|mmetsp:Transcript_30523/g.59997  ORF Transcript_30523/g.59997 Transcript_30523/m.59997 type:complete len:608 (-) Transcript_30523:184-2007(-)|eukprot:Cvel_1541.t1-p1 / transcript=Cvel_1541.t1 / gene=Cvel_1541 / organism=Chromera_velia_CCMP2878 / gene_product=Farnesylcysteine lyase, putative / transcript_product=Farnesylcysteine lyase, putative / location=Cvel_scaffold54:86701-93836(+) / protein_length=607 / sequence_SO=supercontig / SO=protein_coding / is_pseudo=false